MFCPDFGMKTDAQNIFAKTYLLAKFIILHELINIPIWLTVPLTVSKNIRRVFFFARSPNGKAFDTCHRHCKCNERFYSVKKNLNIGDNWDKGDIFLKKDREIILNYAQTITKMLIM
jgi:hypothetical protein